MGLHYKGSISQPVSPIVHLLFYDPLTVRHPRIKSLYLSWKLVSKTDIDAGLVPSARDG